MHLGCSTEGPISATNPKLKTTIHSPNHHQLGVEDKAGLDQVGISSNIDKSPIQIDYEEEEGATKQKQEAAALWEMVKELGVTCGPQQSNYVSKLMEMEKRDKIEAQSVGSMRGIQWTSSHTMSEGGLGRGVKWPTIRRLVNMWHIDMLCIQETKKEIIDKSTCQALWGTLKSARRHYLH